MKRRHLGLLLSTLHVHVFFLFSSLFLGAKLCCPSQLCAARTRLLRSSSTCEAPVTRKHFIRSKQRLSGWRTFPRHSTRRSCLPGAACPQGAPTAGRAQSMRVGDMKNVVETHLWQKSTECIYVPSLPSLNESIHICKTLKGNDLFSLVS